MNKERSGVEGEEAHVCLLLYRKEYCFQLSS